MQTFLLSLFIIVLSVGGLAIGLLFNRPPLRGGCGRLACWREIECAACAQGKLARRP